MVLSKLTTPRFAEPQQPPDVRSGCQSFRALVSPRFRYGRLCLLRHSTLTFPRRLLLHIARRKTAIVPTPSRRSSKLLSLLHSLLFIPSPKLSSYLSSLVSPLAGVQFLDCARSRRHPPLLFALPLAAVDHFHPFDSRRYCVYCRGRYCWSAGDPDPCCWACISKQHTRDPTNQQLPRSTAFSRSEFLRVHSPANTCGRCLIFS